MKKYYSNFQYFKFKKSQDSGWLNSKYANYLYIHAGKGKLILTKGFQLIQKSQLIYLPAWTNYRIQSYTENFCFSRINLVANVNKYPVINNPYGFEIITIDDNEFESLIQLAYKYPQPTETNFDLLLNLTQTIHSYFLQSIPAFQGAQHLSFRMKAVDDYIQNHLNKNITINELAKIAELSESHFTHQFNKEFKMSPKQYIKKLKLELAHHLLIHSDLEIECIKEQIGYQSMSYFHQEFKKKYDVSPKHIRKVIQRDQQL